MSPKTKKQRKEAKRGTKNEQQLTAVTHKDGAPHTIICSYFFFGSLAHLCVGHIHRQQAHFTCMGLCLYVLLCSDTNGI